MRFKFQPWQMFVAAAGGLAMFAAIPGDLDTVANALPFELKSAAASQAQKVADALDATNLQVTVSKRNNLNTEIISNKTQRTLLQAITPGATEQLRDLDAAIANAVSQRDYYTCLIERNFPCVTQPLTVLNPTQ